jgi:hypothetical protein
VGVGPLESAAGLLYALLGRSAFTVPFAFMLFASVLPLMLPSHQGCPPLGLFLFERLTYVASIAFSDDPMFRRIPAGFCAAMGGRGPPLTNYFTSMRKGVGDLARGLPWSFGAWHLLKAPF